MAREGLFDDTGWHGCDWECDGEDLSQCRHCSYQGRCDAEREMLEEEEE